MYQDKANISSQPHSIASESRFGQTVLFGQQTLGQLGIFSNHVQGLMPTEPLIYGTKPNIKSALASPLVKNVYQKLFSYFSTKTYVVGYQKKTSLLSTQNIC